MCPGLLSAGPATRTNKDINEEKATYLKCDKKIEIIERLEGKRENRADAMAFCLPLIIREAQFDDLIESVGKALDATFAEVHAGTVS